MQQVNRFFFKTKAILDDYRFGEDQYFILKYLYHAPVDCERFLTRRRLHNNGSPVQRANQWCMVIQHLKLAFAAWKRNGAGFAGEDLTVGSNNVYCHVIE